MTRSPPTGPRTNSWPLSPTSCERPGSGPPHLERGERRYHLSEEVRADFKAIADNVSLQARLIDDLLDFNRIVRGKFTIERKPRPHDIIREATGAVGRRSSAFADLRLCVRRGPLSRHRRPGAPAAGPVERDQECGQVLAAGGFDPDPDVDHRGAGRGYRPRHRHRNPAADRPAFLSPLFRERGPRGRKEPLRRPRLGPGPRENAVEQHRGTIHAESDGPGRGATIHLGLPLATADEAPRFPLGVARRPKPPSAPSKLDPFVEDHEATRVSLARLLVRRGYAVESADCLRSALEIADGKPFDVLVSDLGLPDGDGCMLLRELRVRQPSILGVAISGYGMDADLARSSEAGFSSHLTKPISIDSLDRALRQIWS